MRGRRAIGPSAAPNADADLPREMIGCAAERLMEPEIGAKTGVDYGEKSSGRLAQRNGYRDRDWQTRAGSVEPRIPRLRTGSWFPSFLEARRSVEKALTAVIEEAYVDGVSARLMDDLVQAMHCPAGDCEAICRERRPRGCRRARSSASIMGCADLPNQIAVDAQDNPCDCASGLW